MKKIKFFALMSAIALASTIGFTACSSSEDVTEPTTDVNPTYDGSSVRTQFAFNIAKASPTRMSAANVQEADYPEFLGMNHMFLLPFAETPDANKTTNANIFALGSLTAAEIVTASGETENSKKIYSLTLPIGTNNFLFYGAADRHSSSNKEVGKITSTLWPSGTDAGSNATKNTNDITFSLSAIISDNPLDKDGDATRIKNYLSSIAQATWNNNTESTDDDVTWASTVNTATSDGAYRALARLYDSMTEKAGEARSGSYENVKRMVFDLYKSAYAINEESSVSGVKGIAKAICQAIESTAAGIVLTVKNGTTIVDVDATGTARVAASTAADWTVTMTGINDAFPSNLGLPMGAAQLRFNSNSTSREFEFNDNATTTTPGLYFGNDFSVDLDKVDYPAELIYFDNSPLRATTSYKNATDFPWKTSTWDVSGATSSAEGFTSDWTETSVSSSTRAVAMKNNVNYGVSLLLSTVQLADGVTTLTDNKKAILAGGATDQTNIDPTKFAVTGILIGGQPGTVNWNMVNDATSASFNHVIYDKDVQFGIDGVTDGKKLSTSASKTNYTVVFDNYCGATTGQKDVLIALELVNGDKDFYGAHNLIPAGSTFYLVGTMTLNGKTFTKATRPTGTEYRITNEPASGTAGAEGADPNIRVFLQDYKATANIKIGATSLKKAYSTIPDLISTETVFGLSVDLKWSPGLIFDVTM